MTLPTTRRAVIAKKPGGPDVLSIENQKIPALAADEILLRVRAFGLSRPDVLQRLGKYALPPNADPVLGLEVAGDVVARGSGVNMGIGTSVCALCNGGGYTDYAIVKAGLTLPAPRGLTAIQAAAIPEAAFTVWYNLFDIGALGRRERVLIHGGTSGVGSFAIQMARAQDAIVFATAGDERKVDACKIFGAHTAINYAKQDFADIIRRETDGEGVEIIMDMVGGDYFAKNIDCLAMDGRLIEIAYLRGAKVELNIDTVMTKRIMITGSKLRPLPMERKARVVQHAHKTLWGWIEGGKVKPVIDKVFPFADIRAAHAYLESGQHIGKVVVEV
jgi:putative PIG3 family NAD(P)H quinone oxidoreductase